MSTLQERLEQAKQLRSTPGDNAAKNDSKATQYVDTYDEFKQQVHGEIINKINYDAAAKNMDAKDDVMRLIEDTVNTMGMDIPRQIRQRLAVEIYNETLGFGPLEELLQSEEITEIMVNGPRQVYVERKGKLELSDISFRDDEHVANIIDRIVSPLGRHCDEATPMVDARLPDGSRVNAIIPPCSLVGPCITIRKFSKNPLQMADLIKFGSISYPMASFLEAAVRGKANIIVFGGTGSGKTTLLNTLSGYIPKNERIVTIEDAAELQLSQPHVVSLESRPVNTEGKGEISIRDLVRNALRMRPDRIVVGEVRSGEALDMLQAMNTGHDGSLTTAHANTARDLIARLETMVLMAGMGLPSRAIREQIASAFNLCVHEARLRDGTRKVIGISEVLGMEGDTVLMQDIFVFKNEGFNAMGKINGRYVATGIRPKIIEKIQDEGVLVKDEWFKEE